MKVTTKNVFTLPDGRYGISENLSLRVRGNSRSYVFRFMAGGIRKDKTLGTVDKLTLTEAKQLADEMRVSMAKGDMPVAPRESLATKVVEDSCPRFADFAEATYEKLLLVKMWKSERNAEQWIRSMRAYAIPQLGAKKLTDIHRSDILKVLKPIWFTKNCTATLVRRNIECVFSYALVEGYVEYNPATWRGNLDMELPATAKVHTTKHRTAMPLELLQEKVSCFLPTSTKNKRAILFTILTCSRVCESVFARWSEID